MSVTPLIGASRRLEHGAWAKRYGGKIPKKMMGFAWGGGIQFSAPAKRMIVGEGIETTLAELGRLAVAGLAGDPCAPGDGWGAECALSLTAIAGRGDPQFQRGQGQTAIPDVADDSWRPPDACEDLVILGDGDMKDARDAQALLARAQRRLSVDRDGNVIRRVRVAWAGGAADSGLDFADMALQAELGAA